MRRAIIVIIILLLVAAAVWIVFSLMNGGGTSPVNSGVSFEGALPSSTPVSTAASVVAAATSSLPAGVPQGETLQLQGTNGIITVKNFYKYGQGYDATSDAIVVLENASYTVLYYRGISHFDIWFSPLAGGPADEAAAAASLARDLSIDQKSLCELSVDEVLEYDGGNTEQVVPLSVCGSGAFQ